MVQQSADAPKSAFEEDDVLVARVVDRDERMKGPERLMPTGRWSDDELFGEFEAARKRTADFAATTDASLRQSGFPHPAFGPLDCYQWLLLIAAHGERHRRRRKK